MSDPCASMYAKVGGAREGHRTGGVMVDVDRSSGEAIFDAVMYEPETRLFTDRAWAILQKELPKARVLAVNVSHLAKEGSVRDAVGEAARNLRSVLGGVFQRL